MELKAKTEMILCLLTLIASIIVVAPMAQSDPTTYGPSLNHLYGRYIESPAAQRFALETGEVDIWFDIRDPLVVGDLSAAGFQMSWVKDTFLYYHIDFNVRDQLSPSGGGVPWRSVSGGDYYTYSGARYTNYVPLDDQWFRVACAYLIPKAEIEAVVYQGITGSAIDSLVPEAQKEWYKSGVEGHAWSRDKAKSILVSAGYVFDPGAPNPAPDPWGIAPAGNWIDPHTGQPMNLITFAGVTQSVAPDSWGRDHLCAREFRAIGLPIEHVEVDFGYLTDTMMDYHQFDMYALGWGIGRFPDQLYSFFHSSQDMIEGYNIPGIHNATLDTLCYTIEHNLLRSTVKQACWDAQDLLAETCVSIPTVTRPFIAASVTSDVAGFTDTLRGIIDSPGYGQDNTWSFDHMRWASAATGGTVSHIVGSKPTNYNPGYASTTDEWMVIQNLYEGMIDVDPYTHADVPWLATKSTIQSWTAPGPVDGMNMTFWLRNDVYWHDGTHYDANSAKWSIQYTKDQKIARYASAWENLDHIDVRNTYELSVYLNVTSLWKFYDVAGIAALFPQHIYAGKGPTFRPEATVNPINPQLTCLIGTGPFVYRPDSVWGLGGFAHLSAYRPGPSPVTTHWWQSVEGINNMLTVMWHWEGDVDSKGSMDGWDAFYLGQSILQRKGDPYYNVIADIAPEGPPTLPPGSYHIADNSVDVFDVYDWARDVGKSMDQPRGFWP